MALLAQTSKSVSQKNPKSPRSKHLDFGSSRYQLFFRIKNNGFYYRIMAFINFIAYNTKCLHQ